MAKDEELAPIGEAGSSIPNIKVDQLSYNGLSVLSGQILEECDPNLRWPQCMYTYKRMLHDDVISSAVEIFNTLIASVPWTVKAPAGYEKELASQVRYFTTLMQDFDGYSSWLQFIKQATSNIHLGFAPFEIVLDYRLKSRGSKYNDGWVRIKKLSLISQDTVSGWEFKNKGRDLSGIWQLVNKPQGKGILRPYKTGSSVNSDDGKTEQFIPRSKFLLFRNNPQKDSPIGTSPFNAIYKAWRMRVAYEEVESMGVNSDVHGLKVLYLPPEYMTPDATTENAAVYEAYKKIMRDVHIGHQSGIILPMYRDEVRGDKMFEFDIVSSKGQKSYDVAAIIERLNKQILTALYADFLILGQGGGGSFALSESKQSIVNIIIRSKLEEIRDVLNHHLIPLIYEENKWDTEVYPTFEFGEADELSIAEFAKATYQLLAAGGIKISAKNINYIAEQLGLPDKFDENYTVDEVRNELSGNQTRAGDGFATTGSGTSTSPNGKDTSASNASNK